MKIQCNVCEAAEAAVLCCADEAALCWTCDEKVHAANKLASKHQRVPLSTSNSHMPKCDICQKILVIFYDVQQLHPNEIRHVWKIIFDVEFPQKVEGEIDNFGHMTELLNSEAVGYFFCLEDRALLCRNCDVAVHTVNTLVSSHQRFLLTGVRVALEAADPGVSSSGKSSSGEKIPEAEISHSLPGRIIPTSATAQLNKVMPIQSVGSGDFTHHKLPFAGGSSAESGQQWQFDDFLALTDFSQNYNCLDNGSSKESALGESEGSPIVRDMDMEVEDEECWAVPQMCSPPTASGLNWHPMPMDCGAFVPDVCSSLHSPHFQQNATPFKRRRQFQIQWCRADGDDSRVFVG